VKLEEFVPAKHPLRPIRTWVNDALAKMDLKFSAMYEADIKGGRPSLVSAIEFLVRELGELAGIEVRRSLTPVKLKPSAD
jgi:hypothetical protein